jgi:cobalt-zinc-cadmium efflux system outer membrane protein
MNSFSLYGVRVLLVSTSLLLACVSTGPASAEESSLTLQALIEEALLRNPDIQAARRRWEASQAIIPQVQSLPDPSLLLGYQRMPMLEPLEGPVYGFSQKFPFPGKLGLKGEVAARYADRIEQEFLATQLNVISRLKRHYWDLHFIHKSIEIVEKNKLLLMQFEKTANARYSVGKTAQQDVFRAQVELSRVLDRLAVLEQQKESLHAAINRILNHPPIGPLGTPEEIHLTPILQDLPELARQAEAFSPILLASAKSVAQGEESVSLARKEYFPDFNLSALGTRNERINENGYQIMLGIQIPLFYQTKQREGVNQAAADLSRAREDLTATRQDLLFQVKDAFERARRATRLVKIVGQAIIPQATLALQSAQAGYGVDKVDFLTLLNNLLTLQENELELHGEMVEHEKSVARLEELTGGPLTVSDAPGSHEEHPGLHQSRSAPNHDSSGTDRP